MLFSLADVMDFEVRVKSQCEAEGFSPREPRFSIVVFVPNFISFG